jgi:hypothetical protein
MTACRAGYHSDIPFFCHRASVPRWAVSEDAPGTPIDHALSDETLRQMHNDAVPHSAALLALVANPLHDSYERPCERCIIAMNTDIQVRH